MSERFKVGDACFVGKQKGVIAKVGRRWLVARVGPYEFEYDMTDHMREKSGYNNNPFCSVERYERKRLEQMLKDEMDGLFSYSSAYKSQTCVSHMLPEEIEEILSTIRLARDRVDERVRGGK